LLRRGNPNAAPDTYAVSCLHTDTTANTKPVAIAYCNRNTASDSDGDPMRCCSQ
jgi:hypothetical protein